MNELTLADHELHALAHEALRLATDYWSSLEERRAYPQVTGSQVARTWMRPWAEEGLGKQVLRDFETIASQSRPANRKFFGYVLGSGEPVGALAELLAAALNQNVTAWRSGPAATTIEHTTVSWLADAVGCTGFKGSLCGGGSAANLMGLAMAREAKLPANEHGARPCVVYASEEIHMSIPKAAALLGIGRENLRLIPFDEHFRMRADALKAAIAEDKRAGRTPIAIVATAGTVNTGAIDPLAEIASIAAEEQLWLHIDGAYGALAAIAAPEKFRGIEQADSLSLDCHKWLYQPVDCSCLLYRDPQAARRAFSHTGDYAKSFSTDPIEGFAFFDESIELSRRFRALKLWMSLQYHGRRAFREAIARDLRHAQQLAEAVKAVPDLELLASVPLSAVCFRHRALDNAAILRRVIARGRVYLSNATLHGRFALRACFVNHRASDEDVLAIVSEVLAAADEIS
jgi:glutamate/tyrosine decarboxylase-like PLP-dependent enzyme